MRLERLGKARVVDTLLLLVAAAATFIFLRFVNGHYPIEHWLFWRYAMCWVACGVWSVAVWAGGHRVLTWLTGLRPIREHVVMSFAVGVLVFACGNFLAGLLGLYGGVYFFAAPVLMLALGGRSALRYVRGVRRHWLAARSRRVLTDTWWRPALAAYGLLGLVAVYLPILLPENISYDSRWYHLAMAEQYAAVGGIFPYRQGWLLGSYPQLASYLYAWAFQLPWAGLFERIELAAHLEFTILLWTLASIPALVRALLPQARAPEAWVAMFLFPGILIYDSSLNGGADHIAAFWAIPIVLSLLRVWRFFTPRFAALFAAMIAGALLTKYSAVAIVVGPLLAFGLRVAWAFIPRRGGSPIRWQHALATAGCALGVALALTAPHWAKNWIWYGDPVYPMLQGKLNLQPWSSEATRQFAALQNAAWRAPRTWAGFKGGLEVLATFSFIPHNWPAMHGTLPVFGSLFTLTAPLLLFVRRARVWAVYGLGHLGVWVWYWVQHEDRYLQGLAPMMAAATAAVLCHLWRARGRIARAGLAALVGGQVVWGSDIYFLPAHLMLGGPAIKAVADHLGAGFRKEYTSRVSPFSGLVEIGKHLKKGDVLLVHESHVQLGLGVATVQDWAGFQGGLYYTDSRSPAELASKLRGFGVTHVMWRGSSQKTSSLAEDLIFFDFMERHTVERVSVSGFYVSKLAARVDEQRPFGDVVAFYGCRDSDDFRYDPGLYHLRDLNVIPWERRPASQMPKPFEAATEVDDPHRHYDRADFVVVNRSCRPAFSSRQKEQFLGIGELGPLRLYVRKTSP